MIKPQVKAKILSLKCAGFTLIELLIVVAILGIIAGIATVNLTESRTRRRLLSSTRDLENWLTDQRRYVMTHKLTCRITIDRTNKQLVSTIDSDPPEQPVSTIDNDPEQPVSTTDNDPEPCRADSSSNPQAVVFDLAENFGNGNEKLTMSTWSMNQDQTMVEDPALNSRIIRLQHQGYSQNHFSDSGGNLADEHYDNGIVTIKLSHQDLQQQRCIRYIFPTGLTRDGVSDGSSLSSPCRYNNAE